MTTPHGIQHRPPALRRTRVRHLQLAGASLSAGLLLAACGSGSGTEQAAPTPEAIAAAADLARPSAEVPAAHPVGHEESTAKTEETNAKAEQATAKKSTAEKTAAKTERAAKKQPAPATTVAGAAQPGNRADSAPTTDAPRGVLPDLQVVHVASGKTVGLRDLAVAGKPTLLWFWAPHCPACKGEAPKVVEFMAQHGQDVQFVGLGARDDLKQAREFLAETGTQDLQMVWDASGESWLHYAVTNQPYFIVLDREGDVKKSWYYTFKADEVGRATEPE